MKAKYYYRSGTGKERSEDFYIIDFDGKRLKVAVGDWASNLVGGPYAHTETARLRGEPEETEYNGGVIGSTLVREAIKKTELTGYPLIIEANRRIAQAYKELGIESVEKDRAKSFAGYIAHAIVTPEKMVVTVVGDVRLAVDGKIIAGKTKKIDEFHANLRAMSFRELGDTNWFKQVVVPLIIAQYTYQNRPGNTLSYPAIDGTETLPIEGVEAFEAAPPSRLLLWSDGFEPPNGTENFTIVGLEEKLKGVYSEDPERCKTYPALRGKEKLDDRTAVEIILDDWQTIQEVNESYTRVYRKPQTF